MCVRLSVMLVVLALAGCGLTATGSPASPSCPDAGPTATADAGGADGGDLLIVGRIVTMDEPAVAEALLIEAGLVTCLGPRNAVLAAAGDGVPVLDIGDNVAYP